MIEIKGLSIHVGEFALKDLSVTIQDKEYFVILGPSGAGKTVFIECLAGLHKIRSGRIRLNQQDITRLSPEERGLGYVPQDYVLFPFLNVRENILFGLKQKKVAFSVGQKRMKDLAELLGISHLLERNPRTLSGGEKQRTALARALAPAPQILLLDEPLSSLDVQTSKYLRLELRRIHQEMGVTTIHITHNHTEAEELADHMAVMVEGRIEQMGRPHEIFFAPATPAVSDFVGSLTILNCISSRQLVPGLMEVDCGGMQIILPHDEGAIQKIAISPRDVLVSDILPAGSVNRFKGQIIALDLNTTTAKIDVKVGTNTIKAEMPEELAHEMSLSIGKEVFIILKLRRLKVMDNRENSSAEAYKWYYQEII
jgi:ABC-type sugar transport system ATPase subunit